MGKLKTSVNPNDKERNIFVVLPEGCEDIDRTEEPTVKIEPDETEGDSEDE